jgi:hypothetical protein
VNFVKNASVLGSSIGSRVTPDSNSESLRVSSCVGRCIHTLTESSMDERLILFLKCTNKKSVSNAAWNKSYRPSA